jgi:hypothetical protein
MFKDNYVNKIKIISEIYAIFKYTDKTIKYL